MARLATTPDQLAYMLPSVAGKMLDVAKHKPSVLLAQPHVPEPRQRALNPCVHIILAAMQLQ